MSLFVKRVERDDKEIEGLERHVAEFLWEIDRKLAQLNAIYGTKEAA